MKSHGEIDTFRIDEDLAQERLYQTFPLFDSNCELNVSIRPEEGTLVLKVSVKSNTS